MRGWLFAVLLHSIALITATGLCLLVLEWGTRVAYGFAMPALPLRLASGIPRLPANVAFEASFLQAPFERGSRTSYVTDHGGARIANTRAARPSARGLLVMGDSQALGYQIRFDQTFAARVARGLSLRDLDVRILAAPGVDLETSLAASREYGADKLRGQRLAIVVVNLGNDLDELYFSTNVEARSAAREWLMQHSYLAMLAEMINHRSFVQASVVPGVPKVLYALLPHERVFLASEAAAIVEDHTKSLHGFEDVVVVTIPTDLQVAATEFDKYERYFRSAADFAQWRSKAHVMAAQMNAMDDYMVHTLRSAGVRAVSFRDALPAERAAKVFERTSHHLTEYGHELLATSVLQALSLECPGGA